MLKSVDPKAVISAFIMTALTLALVLVGSRNLQNYDPALIGYLVGTLFAVFGITYRYSVWIQRPPTKRYFVRTMKMFFSKDFPKYFLQSSKDFVKDIGFQAFIWRRGTKRGFFHFLMAFGCLMAFAITIPLTFGWIHFTLIPSTGLDPLAPKIYAAHFFGFEVMHFPIDSIMGVLIFGALNWFSILVIIGATYFLQKRLRDRGLIATQSFEGEILPLLLLLLVCITGLGLTLNYEFMQGKAFEFMAVTHAFFVIVFLIWIPFGKFFHIIQRPAQVGIKVYKDVGRRGGMQVCKETGQEYTSKLHVQDLKEVTRELGFNFTNEEGESYLDFSPEGKRDVMAKAHLKARQESGRLFG